MESDDERDSKAPETRSTNKKEQKIIYKNYLKALNQEAQLKKEKATRKKKKYAHPKFNP